MKIEFGFQSNCSELVTHLGALSRDGIIAAMKTISRLTGWKWGAWAFGPRIGEAVVVPISDDLLEEVIVISEVGVLSRSVHILVHVEKLISRWEDHLEKWQKEMLREGAFLGEQMLTLYDGPEDEVLVELPDKSIGVAPSDLDSVKKGFNLWISDYEIGNFPQFQAIAREFASIVRGYDGGTENIYAEWLAVHFFPEEAEEIIHERYPNHEKRERAISYLKSHPPAIESSELTKEEKETISRLKDCISRSNKLEEERKKKEQKRASRRWFRRRK